MGIVFIYFSAMSRIERPSSSYRPAILSSGRLPMKINVWKLFHNLRFAVSLRLHIPPGATRMSSAAVFSGLKCLDLRWNLRNKFCHDLWARVFWKAIGIRFE